MPRPEDLRRLGEAIESTGYLAPRESIAREARRLVSAARVCAARHYGYVEVGPGPSTEGDEIIIVVPGDELYVAAEECLPSLIAAAREEARRLNHELTIGIVNKLLYGEMEGVWVTAYPDGSIRVYVRMYGEGTSQPVAVKEGSIESTISIGGVEVKATGWVERHDETTVGVADAELVTDNPELAYRFALAAIGALTDMANRALDELTETLEAIPA